MDLFEDCASDVVTYCTHLTGYVMVALESRRGRTCKGQMNKQMRPEFQHKVLLVHDLTGRNIRQR
ncbi:hypothetical protein C5167_049766 [Papaver somniferum]|uniref:Uncharacterized protein n=1 Tax=Papaver somniferum TaxID=3469 RepID=A0A4Y7KQ87_PAPSO|nr:hypothetical protein C5167_049766 [Papaver somniferum]